MSINITGWTLQNISKANRPTFIFPTYTLGDSDDVIVWTTTGEDTPTDLYWDSNEEILEVGDIIVLRDAVGREIARAAVTD